MNNVQEKQNKTYNITSERLVLLPSPEVTGTGMQSLGKILQNKGQTDRLHLNRQKLTW